jgi:hypothetical protein
MKLQNGEVAAMIVVFIFVLGILSSDSAESEVVVENAMYCDMVDMFKKDNSVGWPDYKNIYSTECK